MATTMKYLTNFLTTSFCVCMYVVFKFCLRQGLTVQPWLAMNLEIHLPAGIKCMPPCQARTSF